MEKLITVVLSLAAGVATWNLYAEVVDRAAEQIARTSFMSVQRDAYTMHLLNGGDWGDSLRTSADSLLQGEGALDASGTTLIWRSEGYCFSTDLPEPTAHVQLVECTTAPSVP